MTIRQITFDKNMTAIIKGVAIIFMIMLHVFGGEGWYESQYVIPLNNNFSLLRFMGALQICVGIYVFMVGFGYAHSKYKNFNYSLTHIRKLLGVYWPVLFIFALPAGLSSLHNSGILLLYNMVGIEETLSWVSWFVYLYIWAMIVMPFIGRLIDRRPYLWGAISAISMFGLMGCLKFVAPEFYNNPLLKTLFSCLGWTPTIIVGYVAGKKKLFYKIRVRHEKIAIPVSIATILITLYLKSRFLGLFILNFDVIYAPLVISCILVIFTIVRAKWIIKIFTELGDKSVYMWFIHGLFFTASTRAIYQRFIMISDNLWVIALWTILLSYLVSIVLKSILETNQATLTAKTLINRIMVGGKLHIH